MTKPSRWIPTEGEAIRVLREPSSTSWEDATYLGRVDGMDGWFRVRLPDSAEPKFISSASGIEVERGHPDAFAIRILILPSRRVRRVAAP